MQFRSDETCFQCNCQVYSLLLCPLMTEVEFISITSKFSHSILIAFGAMHTETQHQKMEHLKRQAAKLSWSVNPYQSITCKKIEDIASSKLYEKSVTQSLLTSSFLNVTFCDLC